MIIKWFLCTFFIFCIINCQIEDGMIYNNDTSIEIDKEEIKKEIFDVIEEKAGVIYKELPKALIDKILETAVDGIICITIAPAVDPTIIIVCSGDLHDNETGWIFISD
jgi:hypothetical protein